MEAIKTQLRSLKQHCREAFIEHPHATGETYREHLWFTATMAARFFFTGFVIITHGLFPFLWKTKGSEQIEKVYMIMKGRIPKARRQEIDAAYEHDYCV